jgi:membrane-associated protease RseP (regulator of RpoE activity)
VKSGHGVLVRSVDKGSAAETAGLKAGDVIVKIGDEKVADRNDFRRAIRDRRSAKVPLGIVRDKKEQTLTITLSEPRKESSRLRGRILQDRDGDIDDDDEDMDIDIDVDMDDWNGMAALVSQEAQHMALAEAQKGMLTAQKAVNSSLMDLQPRIEQEMKKAQERIQEGMKRMEQQLRELQDRQN